MLISVTLLVTLAVSFSDMWPQSVQWSHTLSSDHTTVTASVVEIHRPLWLRIVLLATAGLGVILLLLPGRKKAKI
jgi:hypothetical protein